MDWVHGHLKHRDSCAAAPGKYFLRATCLNTIQVWRWRTAGGCGPGDHTGCLRTFQRRDPLDPSNLCSSPVGPHYFLRTSGFPHPLPWAKWGSGEDWPQDCSFLGPRELWVPMHSEPNSHLIGHLWPQVPCMAGGENLPQQAPPGSRHRTDDGQDVEGQVSWVHPLLCLHQAPEPSCSQTLGGNPSVPSHSWFTAQEARGGRGRSPQCPLVFISTDLGQELGRPWESRSWLCALGCVMTLTWKR